MKDNGESGTMKIHNWNCSSLSSFLHRSVSLV